VEESRNIVFASAVSMQGKTTLLASINKTYKGDIKGQIRVSNFELVPMLRGKDAESFFVKGNDYFFFLSHTMISTVPFKPVPGSVIIPINNGRIDISIIAPREYPKYKHTLDFKFFTTYLENLTAKINRRAVDPVFSGQLVEMLEKEVSAGNSAMAATYLQMLIDLQPNYSNPDLLFSLLERGDVNARCLTLETLLHQALMEAPEPAGTADPAAPKGKNSAAAAETAAPATIRGRLVPKLIDLVRNDPSLLIQSKAAMALSNLQAPEGLDFLESMIDSKSIDEVETCEAAPVIKAEPPKTAVIRAIVEFEGDKSLDILERELLKNKVETFKLILDVFKDYSDTSLYLLLLDLLQDGNFLPRQVAILEYFRNVKDDQTISDLEKLYVSPDAASEFVRKSIIEVLQDFQEPAETVPFIIEHGLHDPAPVVRQASAKALGELGSTAAIQAFRDNYFKESNRLAREFYVEALAKIKSRLAFELLKELREKETDNRMLQQIDFALKKSKYLSL